MKIEVGESLGYSFLRHVKQCWLVQTNWKVSEHWPLEKTDQDLEAMFQNMKEHFDRNGEVFKGNRGAPQLMRQAEIDVVGVDLKGEVHALEVAYHEAGLNYDGGVDNRILKKLLRTLIVLTAYHPRGTRFHIYFISPKVNPSVQSQLDNIFEELNAKLPDIEWNLLTNEDFTCEVLVPTLENADRVSDTSELFVRSAKLLELTDSKRGRTAHPEQITSNTTTIAHSEAGLRGSGLRGAASKGKAAYTSAFRDGDQKIVQPLVQSLMRTILEEHPTLLEESDISNMQDRDYCRKRLGLRIGGFPLLRRVGVGRKGSLTDGRDRYYEKVYAGRFYVCSQWWKKDHLDNAQCLLRLVVGLIAKKPGHLGIPALERHQNALTAYINQATSSG